MTFLWTLMSQKNRTGHHQSAPISSNLQHLCICICPASMSVTNFWYKFPTSKPNNETHKPRLQEPWNQKKQDCKTHETKKNKKKQDCETHESSNLGTLGSDILFFFLIFLVFLFFFGFLGIPCPGHRYRPKMHKQHHYTPGLSFIWCLMDWAPQQKTVETTLK